MSRRRFGLAALCAVLSAWCCFGIWQQDWLPARLPAGIQILTAPVGSAFRRISAPLTAQGQAAQAKAALLIHQWNQSLQTAADTRIQITQEELEAAYPQLRFRAAQAVARDVTAGSGSFWVAAKDGEPIPATCAAVDENGYLLGLVTGGQRDTGLLQPLCSPGLCAACWAGTAQEPCSLCGSDCTLSGLSRSTDLAEGDLVTTNGYGDLFPVGLPVGTVSRLYRESGEQLAEVSLFCHPETVTLLYLVEVRP